MIFRKSNDTQANFNAKPTQMNQGSQTRPQASLSVTPPTSPIAAAAARRTNTAAPSNFARPADQMRKLTVGRDISLNGEITTCDHLSVEGTVKATIKGGKMLDIAETGSFSGVVDIEQADIAGHFDGDLTVRGRLTVRATAQVTGTITYAQLQVDAGAQLTGQLTVLAEAQTQVPEQTATTPQMPMGQTFGLGALNDEPGFLKASA